MQTKEQMIAAAFAEDLQKIKELIVQVERQVPEANTEFHAFYMSADILKQKLEQIAQPERFAKVIAIYKTSE